MNLGTIANDIARYIDVLNAAIRLAPWLPWLQVSGIAGVAATSGWVARGLQLRRRPEHILVFGPTRHGKSIAPASAASPLPPEASHGAER